MIAVIAGASGLVGSCLLQELLADPKTKQVISLVRRPLGVVHSKLQEVIATDFGDLSLHAAQLKGDFYYCCLGTTIKIAGSQENFRKVDYTAIVNFGKLASLHEAKAFVVVSGLGANPKSKIFYNRIKGETESALRALGLHRLVIFQPGILVGHRTEPRPGERFAVGALKALSPLVPSTLTARVATDVKKLAGRMLAEASVDQAGTVVIPSRDI